MRLLSGVLTAFLMVGSLWAGEIHDAAEKGDLAKVQSLLAEHPELANATTGLQQKRPLHLAVEGGHLDVVAELLARGADPNGNGRTGTGQSPLEVAAGRNDTGIMKLLFAHGVQIPAFSRNGMGHRGPLSMAAMGGHNDAIQLLVDHGAIINPKEGDTPLQIAAVNGHVDTVKLLIEYDVDINAKHESGSTVLHFAALSGSDATVDILRAHGAIVNASDLSLLQNAAYGGVKRLVQHLLSENPNVKSKELPLHSAAVQGHIEIIKLFIDRGADVNARDKHGCTPLQSAMTNCHMAAAKLLIAQGADVNAGSGETALCLAADGGSLDLVTFLLAQGAIIPTTGTTPLHCAARGAYHTRADAEKNLRIAVIKLFLDKGLDINGKDSHQGYTPLHLAARRATKDVIALLITEGAKVNIMNDLGHTPLLLAARARNKDAVELLIGRGATINVKDYLGFTPLHEVLRCTSNSGPISNQDQIDLVAMLLAHGANVNASDQRGWTPLYYAVSEVQKSPEIVKLLLSKGANVHMIDRSSQTPLDLARSKEDNQEIIDMLMARKH